jgi:adenylate cyclase class 2
MLEIEMKFPVADFDPLVRRLAEWAAPAAPPIINADHYFNAPDRDFARTDEALRLRRVGSRSWVTYKGPKKDAQAKVRTEIEVPLGDGDGPAEDYLRLLIHLGYRPVAIVLKHRRSYHFQRDGFDLEVCLDEVEEVGRFAEVEILAPEDQLTRAQVVLERVANDLGLGAATRQSYLEMLLGKKGKNPS